MIAFLPLVLAGIGQAAPSWESTLTKDPPGNFPELRPVRATYHFGWSGFTAGTGDMHFSKTADKRFQLEAAGRTIGLVRALWKLDASYRGLADSETLRPIESKQTEIYRKKKLITDLTFTNSGVTRARTEGPGAGTTTTRPFNFPGLFDLHSALLYLRSQPLNDHSAYHIVVYPATSAYLTTVTILAHERVSVRAGAYNAIKIDLQLKRLGKKLELEPHRKFRRATIWISDDENRIPLRIEAQIFVGTVFAELQAVRFDQDKT
ncbi:MAG TPA: DUF3108 domain-containing protein [Chthoniobacterales bacterium]|nr:DUF3108 domain-containing protein [Chthoniobacterales bacterium]